MEERKPKRRRPHDDQDDDAPSPRKKLKGTSKKKTGGALLFILLGGAALLAIGVGVVVLIVIIKSWGGGAGPLGGGRDVVEKDPPPHPMAERLAGPADLAMTAEQLAAEMRGLGGSNKAAEKYKSKVISLSGKLMGVSGAGYLKSDFAFEVKDSMVSVDSTEPRVWEKVLPGQSMKANVMFWQHEPDALFILIGGPVRDVTGKPKPLMTAEALGQEFAADPKAAERKYQVMPHQILYMTGEVLELNSSQRELAGFTLNTGTQYKIKCYTNSGSERGLRPGMRIRMIGAFHAPEVNDPTILRVPSTWVFPSVK